MANPTPLSADSAAPRDPLTTGQPVIGSLSDRTWCGLDRRRPFFLVGALLMGLTRMLMPNAARVMPTIGAALVLAALLLWVLDASINTSMGPCRALIPDIAPPSQHATANAYIALILLQLVREIRPAREAKP